MKTYAHVYLGKVWEIIAPMADAEGNEIPLASRYTSEFCAQCVDVTTITPSPMQDWVATQANGAWTFTPPIA